MRNRKGIAWAVVAAVGTWPLAQTTCTIDPSNINLPDNITLILRGDDDHDDDHHGFHFHDDDDDVIWPWEFDRIDDIDW